jgi:hypothetical protein
MEDPAALGQPVVDGMGGIFVIVLAQRLDPERPHPLDEAVTIGGHRVATASRYRERCDDPGQAIDPFGGAKVSLRRIAKAQFIHERADDVDRPCTPGSSRS